LDVTDPSGLMFTMTMSVVVLNVLAFVVIFGDFIDPSAFIVAVAKLVCIGSIVVVFTLFTLFTLLIVPFLRPVWKNVYNDYVCYLC
jgi:hypothetical protein